MSEITTSSLQETLDQQKAAWSKKAPEDIKTIYAEGIADVIAKGTLEKAKHNGDQAPSFKLKNALGEEVTLSDFLSKGPVVLTWYRGGWCPYCNLTLRFLQQSLLDFQKAGANLLALTPELPDKSLSTAEKHALTFEVLSDVGNQVAKDYGLVFKLTPEVGEAYHNAFNLHDYNGDESDELPLAATYVIDQQGVIQYAFLDAEYRNRAEPSEILEVLKSL